ncbi:MAG: 4Fe-4S binding protein [Alphaproteobacteria bacterium]|nr:4Fe-4S binding protein [Alphaproteobacteria bacterium]
MKNSILIYTRFLAAITVSVLCGLAFFGHFYDFKIFDMQFTAALQSGIIFGLGLSAALFAAVVLVTVLFGRVYCSTLCPLGLYQELLTIAFKPFYKKRKQHLAKHYAAAYFLAAVLFGTLAGGTAFLLRYIDPYSIAGNALSLAPFGLGFVGCLAVLVFFKKRFFCTNICPVGAALGVISRFSPAKIRIDETKCKTCGLCAKACPCGAIDFKNHTVDNETCVKCFKCLSYCRHKALYYGLKQSQPVKFSFKRRQLLKNGAVLLVFGAALKGGIELTKKIASAVKKAILPAGSSSTAEFANRCLNCNLCVANCPMKIIHPATPEIPFVHLDYGEKYCDFDCHKCSQICPSGAIKRLSLKEKQNTKIATAVVNEDVCIGCGLCVFACPKQIIVKEEGGHPYIPFDGCIGCAKCAASCPVKAIGMEAIDKQITLS